MFDTERLESRRATRAAKLADVRRQRSSIAQLDLTRPMEVPKAMNLGPSEWPVDPSQVKGALKRLDLTRPMTPPVKRVSENWSAEYEPDTRSAMEKLDLTHPKPALRPTF